MLDLDPCTDAGCIARRAGKANGEARLGGVVPVNPGGRAEVVYDEIEIAVSIEVATGQTVGDFLVAESPLGGCLGETKVALIPERCVGGCLRWEHPPGQQDFPLGQFPALSLFAQMKDRVQVARVSLHAVRDQKILKAIKVDIDKNGTPTPVRRREAGKMGNLRENPVSPVKEQGIVHPLWAVVVTPRHRAILQSWDHLVFSRSMAHV